MSRILSADCGGKAKLQEAEVHRSVEIKMVKRDNSLMKFECEGNDKGWYQELDMGQREDGEGGPSVAKDP